MKNLILLGEKRHAVSDENEYLQQNQNLPKLEGQYVCDICHNPYEDQDDIDACNVTFLLFNRGLVIAATTTSSNDIRWAVDLSNLDEEAEEETKCEDDWFSITFISELNLLVCLSHGGNIVSIDPQTGQSDSVGTFSNGISDGKWSPDEEILALYTYNADGSSVLLTMNLEFEILNEVSVPQPQRIKTNADGGSNNNLAKETNTIDTGKVPLAQISWRPDATKLAVSSTDEDENQCRIRLYDRDSLEMEYIAREEDGSGKLVRNLMQHSNLAWGGGFVSFVVAGVQQQRKKKMPMVVFMEPNGLRHREFQLREEPGEEVEDIMVYDLCWNVESDILAVTMDGKNKTGSRIQLWHRSNYYWYMKYELYYQHQKVTTIQFDLENPYKLTVVLRNNQISLHEWRIYEFCWDASTVANGCKLSTAIIVDGRNLNFTPLDKAIVPPPMYAATIQMKSPVNHVAHYPHNLNESNVSDIFISSIASLSDGTLVVLGHNKNQTGHTNKSGLIFDYSSPYTLSQILHTDLNGISSLRQITIINHDSSQNLVNIIAVACTQSNVERLVEMQLDIGSSISLKHSLITLEGQVLRITNWADSTPGAVIELIDGTLLSYSTSEGILPMSCEPLMESCPWISAISVHSNSLGQHTGKSLVIGMSKRSRLYCNDILINSAVSSFILNANPHRILSYTTLGSISQLRTLPIETLIQYDPLAGLDNDINAMIQGEGYEPRAVERGSVLVSISNNYPSAILQLPRGNLEGVFPRSLVIPHIINLISNREYTKAVVMMRKQKVDMNLIVDLNPENFVSYETQKFISEVDREDYLNLFIANLRNEDVTMYKHPIPSWMDTDRKAWGNVSIGFGTLQNKVNLLCQTLRRAMLEQQDKDERHYLLPILSTFAKEEPPQLEKALTLIRDNAFSSSTNIRTKNIPSKTHFLSDSAQSSIQYLAFLANYEILYNTALGMYDFDLAKAVARNSQLDPKVYVPQLKKWKNMEPNELARYEVDMKLKRFESALNHLFIAGKSSLNNDNNNDELHFQRCFDLIQEHDLHALGLRLFCDEENRHRAVMISLGEKLLKEKEGNAALSIFLSINPKHWEGAKRAAKACRDWQTFFSCSRASSSDSELSVVANDLAEEIATGSSILNKRENMKIAARIFLDYANDVELAIEKLIAGELWSEARRIVLLHGKIHLERKIVDSAVSFAENCIRDLEERTETFETSSNRYAEVLKIRLEVKMNEEEYGENGDNGMNENGSTYSLSSNLSNKSVQSNTSGSSIGSVTSVSSVITAGGTSTFTITSNNDMYKHKSKFNRSIGASKKSKKKKKSRGKSKKIRPGSQEDLQSIVSALKTSYSDEAYVKVIGETISFLTKVDKLSIAKELYFAYETHKEKINACQNQRLHDSEKQKEDNTREQSLKTPISTVTIGCEEEVDAISCSELPAFLSTLFLYLA